MQAIGLCGLHCADYRKDMGEINADTIVTMHIVIRPSAGEPPKPAGTAWWGAGHLQGLTLFRVGLLAHLTSGSEWGSFLSFFGPLSLIMGIQRG